jgi:MFS family permease
MSTEYAPEGKRGLYSAFPQIGPALGFILGNALFLVLNATMSADAFQSWGWRLPFLFSAVLLVVGFYNRIKIAETPVFQAALESGRQSFAQARERGRRTPRRPPIRRARRCSRSGTGSAVPWPGTSAGLAHPTGRGLAERPTRRVLRNST